MSPLERGENDYLHLQLPRELNAEPERRRRRPPLYRPPTPEDRSEHGSEMAQETNAAITRAVQIRRERGIDSSRLLVLEFDSINMDLRESFEERFDAHVVDEHKTKAEDQDRYRLLVQFKNEDSRRAFQGELSLYSAGAEEAHFMPPSLRKRFYDGLQQVRLPSREDRVGSRLADEGWPAQEPFYLDVDLWHPGDDDEARELLDSLRSLCARYGGRLVEDLRTASLLLAKVRGSRELAEALLDLDIVARVDLPPHLAEAYSRIFQDLNLPDLPDHPNDTDPMVCVVDSGVVAGHPLLANWVIEERDFDTGDGTEADRNGHGTSVAGLVVYGDVAECLARNEWRPQVRICSAKVLRHIPNPSDPETGEVVFPEEHRVERITEEAIRYFATERGCRIFNLSLGNSSEVYDEGRQFAWAEKLDELARELDVVIVVPTVNHANPEIPTESSTREQFQQHVRDGLLTESQRLCNPATASLALTVGAIARSDALGHATDKDGLRLRNAFAGSPMGGPSPFTRSGPGYRIDQNKFGIKPDFVHFGGNYALSAVAGGSPHWVDHILLGEPTIRKERNGRFVGAMNGTSFACAHVSYAAAVAASSLEQSLERAPSANLIRALVGSTAATPPCGDDWLLDEETSRRLVGYGICSAEELTWSRANRVRLIAEDTLEEDKLHVYRVPVPDSFLSTKGRRGITVALAYDPPVRASRKEYLARTMWIEALRGLTTEDVEMYRGRMAGAESPNLPSINQIDMRPPRTRAQWSTLQVRTREWRQRPALRAPGDGEEVAIHLLVGCQKRFPTGLDPSQRYGLVVLFWHEGEHVELYQPLRTRLSVPATRVRV